MQEKERKVIVLNKAIDIASSMPYVKGQQRIAAVIVDKRGNIIASASNDYGKSHPLQKAMSIKAEGNDCRIFLHAEISALLKALRSGKKPDKIFVARCGKRGEPLLAAPCPTCRYALELYGIKHIEHT